MRARNTGPAVRWNPRMLARPALAYGGRGGRLSLIVWDTKPNPRLNSCEIRANTPLSSPLDEVPEAGWA
jgi:hypothetical protein